MEGTRAQGFYSKKEEEEEEKEIFQYSIEIHK